MTSTTGTNENENTNPKERRPVNHRQTMLCVGAVIVVVVLLTCHGFDVRVHHDVDARGAVRAVIDGTHEVRRQPKPRFRRWGQCVIPADDVPVTEEQR